MIEVLAEKIGDQPFFFCCAFALIFAAEALSVFSPVRALLPKSLSEIWPLASGT